MDWGTKGTQATGWIIEALSPKGWRRFGVLGGRGIIYRERK